jgi:hypothetical protein
MKVEGETTEVLPEGSIRDGFMEVSRSNMGNLSCLLTVCAWCKKFRDDRGYWKRAEAYKVYIYEHSYGRVTHGICPDCAAKVTAEIEAC